MLENDFLIYFILHYDKFEVLVLRSFNSLKIMVLVISPRANPNTNAQDSYRPLPVTTESGRKYQNISILYKIYSSSLKHALCQMYVSWYLKPLSVLRNYYMWNPACSDAISWFRIDRQMLLIIGTCHQTGQGGGG